MRLLILGGSGRIGSLALARALAGGHEVVAVVRNPQSIALAAGLDIVAGDVRDEPVLRSALRDTKAVVAALGPRSNTLADELAPRG